MNESERLIAGYLAHQGYSDVIHEPDGKRPPDFLVNGRIAVEVRRLNQNEATPAGARGLEEIAIPLNSSVRKVLASMGPPTDGVSWFVSYTFRRPLPPWKDFERKLKRALADLVAHGIHNGATVKVARGFTIEIDQASELHPALFVLGGFVDDDSGGFVVAELARNLGICVAEKTRKVASFRSKYPEWWLAVVDRIGYGNLNTFDQDQLRSIFKAEGPWNRIILVNPLEPTRGFEL